MRKHTQKDPKSQVIKIGKCRRAAERHNLANVIDVSCLIGGNHLEAFNLTELSEAGCSFVIPESKERLIPPDQNEIALVIYFTAETFLKIGFRIRSRSQCTVAGKKHIRFGCEVNRAFSTYLSYRHLVRLVHAMVECAKESPHATVV